MLDDGFDDWEILVVDDGSTDDTPAVLEELSRRHERLRSIRQCTNRGTTDALRVASERGSSYRVMLMDADGQDDPAGLAAMMDQIDAVLDRVTGRRRHRHDRFVERNTDGSRRGKGPDAPLLRRGGPGPRRRARGSPGPGPG